MDKIKIDYDIFADIQTPLKDSQSDIHKEHIRQIRDSFDNHGFNTPHYYPTEETK